jgi:hypothetical protein
MSVVRMRRVQPMREVQRRYAKVLIHLYNPGERWDLIVPDLPESCRSRAIAHGCSSRDLERPREAQIENAGLTCRTLVVADHDDYYAPAYLASVHSAVEMGRHGRSTEREREAFVGSNGVLTIVGTAGAEKDSVVTAFRVKPHGWNTPDVPAEAFVDAAIDKLEDLSVFKRNSAPEGSHE